MTLLSDIKGGSLPNRVTEVAAEEGVDGDLLARDIVEGKTVIPANKNRSAVKAIGIGRGLRTKVNANVGTSEDYPDLEEELAKVDAAAAAGADAVMDLSTGGDLSEIRRAILTRCGLPLGTVPVYQVMVKAKAAGGDMVSVGADALFEVVEEQAAEGVDFMTIHAGVTRKVLDSLSAAGRVAGIVSRGGAFMAAWMIYHDRENPFYEHYERLLEIARRYDVTLSLGDGLRPGCLADATDGPQVQELVELGGLVKAARDADVQAIVEGPGHLPLNQVAANVRLQKEICDDAPFYVLGPLVTDIAPGYDHITAAIGGALAASAGADFLCYVTPREHLGLPTAQDVRDGVVASRIAGHAADIVKGVPGAMNWDNRMAIARKALNWEEQIQLSIDPDKARQAYRERQGSVESGCTMCSGFCAMKLVSDYLDSSVDVCGAPHAEFPKGSGRAVSSQSQS